MGSIVHDAWSKFGAHYFALFTTYMAAHESVVDGVMTAVTRPVISLLSVAPDDITSTYCKYNTIPGLWTD